MVGQQSELDLLLPPLAVSTVTDAGQRTAVALDPGRGQIVERQPTLGQMMLRKLLLDLWLALEEPVQGGIELILVGVLHTQAGRQRVLCHTATFPTRLLEPCVLAATSAAGCCSAGGLPFERVLEVTNRPLSKRWEGRNDPRVFEIEQRKARETRTLGWRQTCQCGAPTTQADVMDPFAGTGTTLMVGRALGRHGLGIELRDGYVELITRRLSNRPEHPPERQKAA